MQNSIWKLTALAGVIGVGFLIVLQAQDGLKQQDETAALVPAQPGAGPTGAAAAGPADTGDESAATLWPSGPVVEQPPQEVAGNMEPEFPGASEPDFGPLPDEFEPAGTSVAGSQEPGEFPPFEPGVPAGPAAPALSGLPEQPQPTVVTVSDPDFGPDPLGPSPTVAAGSVEPLPLPLAPGQPDDSSVPAPATLTGLNNGLPLPSGTPVAATGIPIEDPFEPAAPQATDRLPAELPFEPGPAEPSVKEQAQQLMAEARTAIEAGQLQNAREKAVAASLLPAVYGPLEKRPAGLIAEIDALLIEATPEPGTPATLVSLPPPSSLPGETGDTPQPLRELPSPFPTEPVAGSAGPSVPLPLPGLPTDAEPVGTAVTEASPPQPQPEFVTEAESTSESPTEATVVGTAESPGAVHSTKQLPELTIEKVAPAEATLSEPMIYSIHIANRGSANAAQVVVEDQVPKGCRLVGTIPQAELIGTKLLWRLGRLPSGGKKKILVKVVPIEEGEVGSIATVSFVSEVATRTSVRQPKSADLRLSMQAPPQASIGQNVVFSFQIENTGNRDAEDVKLQDIIPVGFEHPAGEDLTYDVGKIPAGESFEIDLELKAVKAGQHTNRAIVKADNGETVESAATVDVLEHTGLTFTAAAGEPVVVGQRFTQRITVSNATSQVVPDTSVIMVLARQMRFISATGDGVYDKTTSTLRWTLPAIAPGESILLDVVAIGAQAGKQPCLVQLLQPGHEMQSIEVARTINGVAALHLDLKDVPATAFPDDEFAVHVRLLNRGTSADSDVQFSVLIPSELDLVEARGPVKNLPPETIGGHQRVTFNTIPEIGEGASVDFEITLKAREPGRPKLRAEVRSSQLTEPVATEAAVVVIDTAP